MRPISLLSIALKIVSKALADCLKKCLPFCVFLNQTAHLEERFISEWGRLVSDIFHVADFLKIKGLYATIDI